MQKDLKSCIHEGSEAPEKCPLCGYPRAYFKPYCEIEDL